MARTAAHARVAVKYGMMAIYSSPSPGSAKSDAPSAERLRRFHTSETIANVSAAENSGMNATIGRAASAANAGRCGKKVTIGRVASAASAGRYGKKAMIGKYFRVTGLLHQRKQSQGSIC